MRQPFEIRKVEWSNKKSYNATQPLKCSWGETLTTAIYAFSVLTVGEDWVLPLLIVGESTTVALSPPNPSSEEAVPGTEMLCLETILVGMLGQLPKRLVLVILGCMSHGLSHQRTHTRTAAEGGTDGRAGCEEAEHELASRANLVNNQSS